MNEAETAAATAIFEGRAVADLSSWIKVLVTGREAGSFLHDLVTADVAGLTEGGATRSLLLTPTGRVRADVTVARLPEGYLLVQHPSQPRSIGDLLEPYVLSAEVRIADQTESLALLAVIGPLDPGVRGVAYRPGALGTGSDLVLPARLRDDVLARLTEDRELVGEDALEAWRIARGRPRFGADFTEDSLPAEAGLEGTIDFTKGCFLGQESVAKVRNLGHPPFLILAVRSAGAVAAGDAVLSGGAEVGSVTSVAEVPEDGFAALARVRWEARDGDLVTAAGAVLSSTPRSSKG
jgi:folate-binding protein YgfZ